MNKANKPLTLSLYNKVIKLNHLLYYIGNKNNRDSKFWSRYQVTSHSFNCVLVLGKCKYNCDYEIPTFQRRFRELFNFSWEYARIAYLLFCLLILKYDNTRFDTTYAPPQYIKN